MPEGRRRIAVALDASDRSRILELARLVGPEVGVLKVGLEAFCAHGPGLVAEVAALAPVFLDLKLHDIPNTVGAAAAAAARTGAAILNVHAGGGRAMMRAAGERAREAAAAAGLPGPKVIAVTVLTSLDAAALAEVGFPGTPRETALRLAVLARESGLDGVVCSPEEIEAIRAACGPEFLLVVPGIRPAGSDAGDQKRIATPAWAAKAGADLLVIGRPITGASDPAAAARAIAAEIEGR
jgi:orotidine-5'-phosphate decarboxylase